MESVAHEAKGQEKKHRVLFAVLGIVLFYCLSFGPIDAFVFRTRDHLVEAGNGQACADVRYTSGSLFYYPLVRLSSLIECDPVYNYTSLWYILRSALHFDEEIEQYSIPRTADVREESSTSGLKNYPAGEELQ